MAPPLSELKRIIVSSSIPASSIDNKISPMVWQHEKVSSWYQNSSGKVVTTSPWKLLEYWNWTKKFNSDDYEF